MDIDEAIAAIGTEVPLPGIADKALATKIDTMAKGLIKKEATKPTKSRKALASKPAVEPTGLGSGSVMVRPLDALLRLARATTIGDTGDVFDAYMGWGLLRYLGAFDPTGPKGAGLCLSDHANRIGGNQRRVLSEDLGIGFGVLLAEEWCRQDSIDIVNAVDIDRAVREGPGWAPLNGADIQVGGRQPDYLLVCSGAGPTGTVQFRALECKGTSSESYARDQLARAVTQLASLTVNGVTPPGLATSVVSSRPIMKFFGVDPDDGRRHSYRLSLRNPRLEVNVAERNGRIEIDGDALAAIAARSAYGTLAEFAGNTQTADTLRLRGTAERSPRRHRDRGIVETDLGNFRGITTSHPTPDGRWLQVFQGVETSIDDALTRTEPEEVADLQVQFARRTADRRRSITTRHDNTATAIAPEGSILQLNVVDQPLTT